MSERIAGSCLCGAVEFSVAAFTRLEACHCGMCQRWTSSVLVSAEVASDDVDFEQQDGLVWYRSSDKAERGFCDRCGSSLFFRFDDDQTRWGVAAGSLELPRDRKLDEEIFVDERPAYLKLSGRHRKLTGKQIEALMAKAKG